MARRRRTVSGRSYLSIGDVLTLLRQEFPDVTISKIRFLESQGLVNPERTPSGYRKFYDADVDRLRWVLRQQREHFLPLKVIKDRLDERETSTVPTTDDGADAARPAPSGPGSGSEELVEVGAVSSAPARAGAVVVHGGEGAASAAHSVSGPVSTSTAGRVAAPGPLPPGRSGGLPSTTEPALGASSNGAHRRTGPVVPVGARATVPATGSAAPGNGGAAAGSPGSGASGAGRTDGVPDPERAPGPGGPSEPTALASSGPAGAAPTAPVPPGPTPTPAAATAAPAADPTPKPTPAAATAAPAAEPVPLQAARPGSGGVGLTADELATAAGADPAVVRQLHEFGLVAPVVLGGVEYFDEGALAVAKLAASFAVFGIEPRHLRLYKHAAEREAGFVEQVVVPLLRQRNPEARGRAATTAAELARLGQALRSELMRQALVALLGHDAVQP